MSVLRVIVSALRVGVTVSPPQRLTPPLPLSPRQETEQQASDLQSFGRDLQLTPGDLGCEGVEARCVELRRLAELTSDKLQTRAQLLKKCRDLQERVERVRRK